MPENRIANSFEVGSRLAVEHHDGGGRNREQHRAHIAQACRYPAEEIDRETAKIGHQDGQRPWRFKLGHALRTGKPGKCRGVIHEGRGPEADKNRKRRQRKGKRHGEQRRGGQRYLPLGTLQANPLHDQHVIDRRNDGRERACDGHKPLSPLDGRVQNDELGERALKRRQSHYGKYAETEQRGRDRHALATSREILQVCRTGAVDEIPAGCISTRPRIAA